MSIKYNFQKCPNPFLKEMESNISHKVCILSMKRAAVADSKLPVYRGDIAIHRARMEKKSASLKLSATDRTRLLL